MLVDEEAGEARSKYMSVFPMLTSAVRKVIFQFLRTSGVIVATFRYIG